MAVGAADPAPRAETSPPAAVTPDGSSDRLAEERPIALADATDLAPTDSHPMIPLPPAIWAGFIGLAYVARRVTRRNPI
jgi:hypothetical protein